MNDNLLWIGLVAPVMFEVFSEGENVNLVTNTSVIIVNFVMIVYHNYHGATRPIQSKLSFPSALDRKLHFHYKLPN